MKKPTITFMRKDRGVTLLIAILLASITLAVGLGVYHRTYKEIIFSAFWKQAQIAFANADGGMECALYYELHPAENPVSCFGITISTWTPGTTGSFNVNTGDICALVEITHAGNNTNIKSYGYNTCDTTSSRRVERGLEVNYGT